MSPSITTEKYKYGSKSLYIDVKEGNSEIAYVMNSISYIENHIYYISLQSYLTTYTKGYRVMLHVSGLTNLIGNSNLNEWSKVSKIITSTSSATTSDVRIGKCYGNTDEIWSAYIDGAILIDLTATFGSGNEPDKDWCDRRINYFDGTITIYK